MKHFTISLVVLLMLSSTLDAPATPDEPDNNDNNNPMDNKLTIRVGTSCFGLTLGSNATATAFKALLPLTLNMSEHNGNEKFFNLSTNLPTATTRPGILQTGDLMLFGSNCLVLFYETFSSSYSYTRLGRVDNPAGLATALGSGSATVLFEIARLPSTTYN